MAVRREYRTVCPASGYPVVGGAAVLVLDRKEACQECCVAVTGAKAYTRATCATATENLLVGEPLEARTIARGVDCQCLHCARAPGLGPGLGHIHDWPGRVGVAAVIILQAAKQKADFIRKYPAYSGSSNDKRICHLTTVRCAIYYYIMTAPRLEFRSGQPMKERSLTLGQTKDRKTASLTACVAYFVDVDISKVPGDGGVRLNQWLAVRNLGLVPVESAKSFEWPGRFIGLRDDTSSWAVFFGVPPGVLYDPAGESEERGDVGLKAAFVLAEHDPLREVGTGQGSEKVGEVEVIALAEKAEAPMRVVPSAEAVEGCGLVGDRYEKGAGTFSDPNGRGYDLTLVEAEAMEELASKGVTLAPEEARRNLVVRGIALDDLVGRRFQVGEVECLGQRRCEPCAHLERLTRPGVLRGLVHRGGLRADVLSGGEIRTGDRVEVSE